MIIWGDTIKIILDLFDTINQKQLAGLLGISESSLSKIKAGKRNAPFNSEAVFDQVFNPDMADSPAKDKPQFLLDSLKTVISAPKYENVRIMMDDCWNETDYKTFVMSLLNRTRNNGQNSDDSVPACLPQSDSAGISAVGGPSVRSFILPHSDKCCFYCVYWRGDCKRKRESDRGLKTIGEYLTKSYGFCRKYNRENQPSSDTGCKEYKANQDMINRMQLLGVNTEGLV